MAVWTEEASADVPKSIDTRSAAGHGLQGEGGMEKQATTQMVIS